MEDPIDPLFWRTWHAASMNLLTQMVRHEATLTPVQLKFLSTLADLIEAYEKCKFPFDVPTPEEMKAFRREQEYGPVGACPWCGTMGYGFAEAPQPSDYCGHDPALAVRKP